MVGMDVMDPRDQPVPRDQPDSREQLDLLESRGKKEIQEHSYKGLMDPRDQQDLPVLRGKREIKEHSYKDLLACEVQAICSYFSGRVCSVHSHAYVVPAHKYSVNVHACVCTCVNDD